MREEYSRIPGTTVFDGEQSRRGYHLNQFCMSLLIPANRDRSKADEEAYLGEWKLTETQKLAVLRRDYNAMIAEGGNIYFRRRENALKGEASAAVSFTPRGGKGWRPTTQPASAAGRRSLTLARRLHQPSSRDL
jgi:protocatechuate 4,5-dioxygenase alpha chain